MSVFMLEILTPKRQFYRGEVEALTCTLPDGQLTVLKSHRPDACRSWNWQYYDKKRRRMENRFFLWGFIEVLPRQKFWFLLRTVNGPRRLTPSKRKRFAKGNLKSWDKSRALLNIIRRRLHLTARWQGWKWKKPSTERNAAVGGVFRKNIQASAELREYRTMLVAQSAVGFFVGQYDLRRQEWQLYQQNS